MATRHEAEIEHGAKIASDADSVWGWSSPAGQRRALRRAELLLSRAGARKGARILELGCGIGIFTELLGRSSEATFVGVDISHDLLRRARERCPKAAFERGAIEALPHPAATFDAVIGSSVLHHLELGPALSEVRRVLKPGGRFVVAEPNMLNPQIMIQKNVPFVKRLAGDTPDETAFFRWRIARDLERAGFSAIEIEPYDFLHPMVPAPLIGGVALLGNVLERLPLLREFAGSLIISAARPAAGS
ncbi:MAG TPA: methyltransferase domain-containing protein [Planctomycetota bacterium]|nr:methyltransferase domain-containing protein [Planctomycetota bacterium]